MIPVAPFVFVAMCATPVVLWLVVKVAGFTLPEYAPGDGVEPAVEPDYVPSEIPTLVGLRKLTGQWTPVGDSFLPGEVPGVGWWIYRQFSAEGQLIYVGKTNNARRRFGEHVDTGKVEAEGWDHWELYACRSETEMDEIEKLAILYNDPQTNKERWIFERHIVQGRADDAMEEEEVDPYDEEDYYNDEELEDAA